MEFSFISPCVLKHAKENQLPQIMSLYRSAIGTNGCTWNETYPNKDTLLEDFHAESLFVLLKGMHIIGAGSIVPANELDDLDCWQHNEHVKEIARIVIAPQFQGKGYGKQMIQKLCQELDLTGCAAVHILVAKENCNALNLYRRTGFQCKGSCHRYGMNFYAYEKKL